MPHRGSYHQQIPYQNEKGAGFIGLMTETFVGYSTDNDIRYKSASGGITTAILKYLFEKNLIGTAIGCVFNENDCRYEPQLIYAYEEYKHVGSVYQDIDLVRFINANLKNIKGKILVICAPCQVSPIRNTLKRHNIESFIIDYFCSGQTTLEGTYCYYKFLGIDKNDVKQIKYRGNGWPNGIEVILKNGETITKPNFTEPWSTIHHSRLFLPKRCHYCKIAESKNADISVGDPWLDEFKKDHIGHTLFLVHTTEGIQLIHNMQSDNAINCRKVDYSYFTISQKPNLLKAKRISEEKDIIEYTLRKAADPQYMEWGSDNINNLKKHISKVEFKRRIKRYKKRLSMLNPITFLPKSVKKFKQIYTYLYWRNKFGGLGKGFSKGKNITIKHPKCIYIGKNVGIGNYAHFLPCTSFAGEKYKPTITVGDGTWIGIRNSFAAIHGITIGKNVLFAGYVHVTDHSHGYEDINIPISKQKLISKGPVVIEDDCWLGFNSEILSGVHIGKHAIVAAHAVVTKDVPPYTIVAGNPARPVKHYNFETGKWEKI